MLIGYNVVITLINGAMHINSSVTLEISVEKEAGHCLFIQDHSYKQAGLYD